MDQCHEACVKMLKGLFKLIPNMGTARVLEPGCGDGRLTQDFLQFRFQAIDMFDKCEKAIDKILAWKDTIEAIDRCECSLMSDFQSSKPYDVIIMRWVSGYLPQNELI